MASARSTTSCSSSASRRAGRASSTPCSRAARPHLGQLDHGGHDFRSFTQLDQLATYRRGQQAQVPFFRGTDDPGRRPWRRVGARVRLRTVRQGRRAARLPVDDVERRHQQSASTTTAHGRCTRVSAVAAGDLLPIVKGVKPGQRMRLVARRRRRARSTGSSSHTCAVVPPATARVPILRAAYVPPTNLHSVGKPGALVPDHLRQPRPGRRQGREGQAEVVGRRTALAPCPPEAHGQEHVPRVVREPGRHRGSPLPEPPGGRYGRGRPVDLRDGRARLPAAARKAPSTPHDVASAAPRPVPPEQALPYVGPAPVLLLREAERRHQDGRQGRSRPGRLGRPRAA